MQDPTLELRDGNGALIRTNNDWQDDPNQSSEISAAGLAREDARESAIAENLGPGNCTAILAGQNGVTGVVLWRSSRASNGGELYRGPTRSERCILHTVQRQTARADSGRRAQPRL